MSQFRSAEVKIVPANKTRQNMVSVGNLTVPDRPAELFIEFAKVCNQMGTPDGFDNNGALRMRPMTPTEVVDRAAEITKAVFERIDLEKWWLHYPTYDEIENANTEQSSMGFTR